MATVIVGGGIIGTSVAYYLSDPNLSREQREIHIVDTSSELFASSSGYAAGFMAKDWFAPETASLGKLSFELHRQLAQENDGRERWGYMESTAVALQTIGGIGTQSAKGNRRLGRGARVTEVAESKSARDEGDPSPLWLTEQPDGSVEKISDDGDTAQVDPLRLSQFLMNKCIERGVKLHYPARATCLRRKQSSSVTELVIEHLDNKITSNIPCENLVFTAGVWTPRAFASLFPGSTTSVPVTGLPGYSLVLHSPRHTATHEHDAYGGKSHAVFAANPRSAGFSPEIFSRAGAEIYISGLDVPGLQPPEVATDSRQMIEKGKSARLKRVAVNLLGKPGDQTENEDDLEVVREGLCFRPLTQSGIPIIAKLPEQALGNADVVPCGGVFMGVGHGPWGIALSLGTGKVLAEMIAGVDASADVSTLRFRHGNRQL